jgi:hypothetical protein
MWQFFLKFWCTGRRRRRWVALTADWEEDWSPRGYGHQGEKTLPDCCCVDVCMIKSNCCAWMSW